MSAEEYSTVLIKSMPAAVTCREGRQSARRVCVRGCWVAHGLERGAEGPHLRRSLRIQAQGGDVPTRCCLQRGEADARAGDATRSQRRGGGRELLRPARTDAGLWRCLKHALKKVASASFDGAAASSASGWTGAAAVAMIAFSRIRDCGRKHKRIAIVSPVEPLPVCGYGTDFKQTQWRSRLTAAGAQCDGVRAGGTTKRLPVPACWHQASCWCAAQGHSGWVVREEGTSWRQSAAATATRHGFVPAPPDAAPAVAAAAAAAALVVVVSATSGSSSADSSVERNAPIAPQ